MASSFLPKSEGALPYYLMFTGTAAIIHSIVCYTADPAAATKGFSGPARPPPTGLLARVYGVKNIYTSLIRLTAAYHITNPQLYDLGMATFAGVLFLYGLEVGVYKTAKLRESISTFVVAGTGLGWMLAQRDWYRSL
ncbi:ergosterol biosynthesis protein-like protein Erg28 [Xylariales sp. PMI_506]|nr:ergosterol biosynthesis protein-like protein Erg28 [Xylariales sp. PMI_506]